MNKSELEVGTANLNISLSPADERLFYNFRWVNFKKLEDEINSVLSPILGDDNKNITGEWAYNVLSIYGRKLIY